MEAMWSVALAIQNSAPFITERLQNLTRHPTVTATYYARIVRAVQLSVFDYLQQVSTNIGTGVMGVELPVFQGMLQDLKRGTFHLSTNWVEIPEAYLDPIVSHAQGSAAPSGTVVTAASTRSTLSTLTGDPSARATTPPVSRVPNPNPDPAFTSITLRPGGSRAVLREHPPPTNDAGIEFCVAWWTRGGCFQNCGRRASHVEFASPGERSRLLTYVRERLQAPAAAPT